MYDNYRFKAETLRTAAFAVASPLGIIIFNVIVLDHSIWGLLSIRVLAALLLFILGIKFGNRANELVEERDELERNTIINK